MRCKAIRCGYCGQPTDENGWPLKMWQIAVMNPFVDWDDCENTQGECCREEQSQQYVTVTREMALDAGCPEMEGTLWRW